MTDQPRDNNNRSESINIDQRITKQSESPGSTAGSYYEPDNRGYTGGYSDGYNAGYEAGYRRSMASGHRSHHHSSGYDDDYDGSYRSSSRHHSHRHSSGYDDDYYDGSYRSSSRHRSSSSYHRSGSHHSNYGYDDDDSRTHHSSKPGRLASHHRSRHHRHHHHSDNSEAQESLPPTYEALPVDTSRIGMKTEIETAAIPMDPQETQNRSSDEIRTADPADYYYADMVSDWGDNEYVDGSYPDGGDSHYGNRRGIDRIEDDYFERQDTNSTPGPLAATIVAASAINPPKTYDASTIESSGSRRRKRKLKKRQTFLSILARILIVLILLFVAGIGGLLFLRARGEKAMSHNAEDVMLKMEGENTPEDVEKVEDEGRTITYKGEKYRWNDRISTILFLGSDRTLEAQESRESTIGINGQADTILLGVIDNKNKKISFINVNRDTMTNVAQYTPDGDYAGDKQMQICLAYSYGKDNVESCRLMASTVSNLLYGIPVDSYARISYDAVPTLNDSVGGVTVKVLEDMPSADPAFVKGAEVTLAGNQALKYIRWRNKEVTETNELRMARQKQYFYAFANRTIEATRADLTLPLGLYNNAKPYMTTDITPSRVTYLTSKVLEYGVKDGAIRSVKGSSVDGPSGLVEFHTDDTQLYEMILDVFYNKVEK